MEGATGKCNAPAGHLSDLEARVERLEAAVLLHRGIDPEGQAAELLEQVGPFTARRIALEVQRLVTALGGDPA